jgi:hypothetical protein
VGCYTPGRGGPQQEKNIQQMSRRAKYIFSPTHKQTEGRAPMWGSEFTLKDATLQGNPAETAAGLNVKLWDSVRGGGGAILGFLNSQNRRKFEILLNDLKLTWWFSLLYFAPCRPPGQCAPSPQAFRHTPAPGRSAGGPRRVFFAACANGTNMRQWLSARREPTARDYSSSKVHRREG